MIIPTDPFHPCSKLQKNPGNRPPSNMIEVPYFGATLLQEFTARAMHAILMNGNYTTAKDVDNKDPAKVAAAMAWVASTAKAQALALITELNK